MGHMILGQNVGLLTTRQTRDKWDVFVVRDMVTHKSLSAYDITSIVPLYLYTGAGKVSGPQGSFLHSVQTGTKRKANLNPSFLAHLGKTLSLKFVPSGSG